jgi:hypothetical protein
VLESKVRFADYPTGTPFKLCIGNCSTFLLRC